MSVTYGFYNSKNRDRRYDAIQMSSIFDGIIRDGVLQHFGTAMMVKESEGMMVNVGIGRAWFNHMDIERCPIASDPSLIRSNSEPN